MSEKFIKNFSVKGKTFQLRLKYDCHKLVKGICSLDIDEEEVEKYLRKEFKSQDRYENYNEFKKQDKYHREDSVLYCRNLANSIKREGFKYPIYIYYCKCGHYSFSDGQHRACIASKLNLTLPANIDDISINNQYCYCCRMKIKKEEAIKFQEKLIDSRLERHKLKKLLVRLNIIEKEKPNTAFLEIDDSTVLEKF